MSIAELALAGLHMHQIATLEVLGLPKLIF